MVISLKEIVSKCNTTNPEEAFAIVEKIKKEVSYETANSGTFSMALDCIEKKGKIYVVTEEK